MSPFSNNSFELRTLLKIGIGILAIAVFVAYLIFQARLLIIGPQITLNEEIAPEHNTRMIELLGKASNITHLWLNDRQIFTDEEGNFKEALILENGYTITTLRAKDRYGRETRVVRSFVYTPASIVRN
jgi:hypothetical protein